jgi:hypothetical protein
MNLKKGRRIMASQWAMERAAQTWCRPEVSRKEMDTELAMAFAEVLDELCPEDLRTA